MGTFEGHLLPGSAFVLLGLWQLFNVIADYVGNPAAFRTRTWFPAKLPWKLKYIELMFISLAAAASIAMELVVAQKGHWMLDSEGHIPIHMMAQFEHASMSLFFLLYALIALATEGCFAPRCRPLPFGFLHTVAIVAFAQEYLLFYFHSGDHMGVEGQYHTLLRIPIGIILACGVLELLRPRMFVFPLVRAAAIVLQGLVLIQTAFAIWVPAMWPLHCTPTETSSLWCDGEEWVHRAKALANLEFNWLTAALLVFTVVLFVALRSIYGEREYSPISREAEDGLPRRQHKEQGRLERLDGETACDLEEGMSEGSERSLSGASRQSSGDMWQESEKLEAEDDN